jgi:hypothetical protein
LIRGFRVERQEIEATLSTHPDILEAVVETVADAESETDLIAFVAPIAGRSLSDTDTRAWLPPPALHGAGGHRGPGGAPEDADRQDRSTIPRNQATSAPWPSSGRSLTSRPSPGTKRPCSALLAWSS